MVVCLEQGADLHMAQLMPLPLTVSCFSKIQIVFTFLVLAHLGSPGKWPLNGCVCVRVAIVCTASNASTLLIGQQIGNMVFIKPISVIPKGSFCRKSGLSWSYSRKECWLSKNQVSSLDVWFAFTKTACVGVLLLRLVPGVVWVTVIILRHIAPVVCFRQHQEACSTTCEHVYQSLFFCARLH